MRFVVEAEFVRVTVMSVTALLVSLSGTCRKLRRTGLDSRAGCRTLRVVQFRLRNYLARVFPV